MKILFRPLLLMQAIAVHAHYYFNRLHINGQVAPDYRYIRKLPNYAQTDAIIQPIYDVESLDIRCNRGGSTAGKGVEAAKVQAGNVIGFGRSKNSSFDGPDYSTNTGIFHSGPNSLHLSKAPADLDSYTGDGDWFKISQYGAKSASRWEVPEDVDFINFTIPKTTPPGKYLMRFEHGFGRAGAPLETMQFYVSCGHLEISGPGGGSPGPTVKFPGANKNTDLNVAIPQEWAKFPIPPTARNLLNPKFFNTGAPLWSG